MQYGFRLMVRAYIAATRSFPHDAGLQFKSVRVRNIRIFPFLEYDSSVADILSGRPERVSAKKGPPPGHSALRFGGPPLTE